MIKYCSLTCKCSCTNFRIFVRKKSLSSHAWLERRQSDKYIELAKKENYRCRSAFKLLEINDRFKIIHTGHHIIDLGAAPGSWTQVLVRLTNADGRNGGNLRKGMVLSVDKQPMRNVPGAYILPGSDFTCASTQQKILNILGDNPRVNAVVSDMAPNATGIKSLDQESIFLLATAAARFAITLTQPAPTLLVKLWDNSQQRQQLEQQLRLFYSNINFIRPKATQTESSEIFLLARNIKTDNPR